MPWSYAASGGGDGSVVAPTTVTGPNLAYMILNAAWTDPQPLVLLCNSTGGAITLIGPGAPTAGRQLVIKDLAGTALTNAITFSGNGNNIDGFGASVALTTNYQAYWMVYTGTAWAVI